MQRKAYTILTMVMLGWISAIFYRQIDLVPYGVIGIVAIAAFGRLFLVAIKKKLDENTDDQ